MPKAIFGYRLASLSRSPVDRSALPPATETILGWNKIRAGSFTADLQLKESPMNGQPAFDMESRMENLQIGSFPVKGFHLQTSGVLKGHRAKLAFLLDGGEIEGEMEGGYERGLWKGTIARLTGKDAKGLWNLQAPAKVRIIRPEVPARFSKPEKQPRERDFRPSADLAWIRSRAPESSGMGNFGSHAVSIPGCGRVSFPAAPQGLFLLFGGRAAGKLWVTSSLKGAYVNDQIQGGSAFRTGTLRLERKRPPRFP